MCGTLNLRLQAADETKDIHYTCITLDEYYIRYHEVLADSVYFHSPMSLKGKNN